MGWHVHVSRNRLRRNEDFVAAWHAHTLGLTWIESLVTSGEASFQGGDGYPDRYLIRADALLSTLEREASISARRRLSKPPHRFAALKLGPGASECAPSDILYLEAWDSS